MLCFRGCLCVDELLMFFMQFKSILKQPDGSPTLVVCSFRISVLGLFVASVWAQCWLNFSSILGHVDTCFDTFGQDVQSSMACDASFILPVVAIGFQFFAVSPPTHQSERVEHLAILPTFLPS